jgi:hypothetical protein
VSFNTLSAHTVQACSSLGPGAVICVYKFDPADVCVSLDGQATTSSSIESTNTEKHASKNVCVSGSTDNGEHCVHAICWRGTTRTLNVMCGKTGNFVKMVV